MSDDNSDDDLLFGLGGLDDPMGLLDDDPDSDGEDENTPGNLFGDLNSIDFNVDKPTTQSKSDSQSIDFLANMNHLEEGKVQDDTGDNADNLFGDFNLDEPNATGDGSDEFGMLGDLGGLGLDLEDEPEVSENGALSDDIFGDLNIGGVDGSDGSAQINDDMPDFANLLEDGLEMVEHTGDTQNEEEDDQLFNMGKLTFGGDEEEALNESDNLFANFDLQSAGTENDQPFGDLQEDSAAEFQLEMNDDTTQQDSVLEENVSESFHDDNISEPIADDKLLEDFAADKLSEPIEEEQESEPIVEEDPNDIPRMILPPVNWKFPLKPPHHLSCNALFSEIDKRFKLKRASNNLKHSSS